MCLGKIIISGCLSLYKLIQCTRLVWPSPTPKAALSSKAALFSARFLFFVIGLARFSVRLLAWYCGSSGSLARPYKQPGLPWRCPRSWAESSWASDQFRLLLGGRISGRAYSWCLRENLGRLGLLASAPHWAVPAGTFSLPESSMLRVEAYPPTVPCRWGLKSWKFPSYCMLSFSLLESLQNRRSCTSESEVSTFFLSAWKPCRRLSYSCLNLKSLSEGHPWSIGGGPCSSWSFWIASCLVSGHPPALWLR